MFLWLSSKLVACRIDKSCIMNSRTLSLNIERDSFCNYSVEKICAHHSNLKSPFAEFTKVEVKSKPSWYVCKMSPELSNRCNPMTNSAVQICWFPFLAPFWYTPLSTGASLCEQLTKRQIGVPMWSTLLKSKTPAFGHSSFYRYKYHEAFWLIHVNTSHALQYFMRSSMCQKLSQWNRNVFFIISIGSGRHIKIFIIDWKETFLFITVE